MAIFNGAMALILTTAALYCQFTGRKEDVPFFVGFAVLNYIAFFN